MYKNNYHVMIKYQIRCREGEVHDVIKLLLINYARWVQINIEKQSRIVGIKE